MVDRDGGILRELSQVPLFHNLPADQLGRIVGLAHQKEVDAGAFFFHEGDPEEAFFVLTHGRVKLTQLTEEGHRVVLRLIGRGDAFGGVGAFGDPTYLVSAEPIERSTALAWTSATMRHLLETRDVGTRAHELAIRKLSLSEVGVPRYRGLYEGLPTCVR